MRPTAMLKTASARAPHTYLACRRRAIYAVVGAPIVFRSKGDVIASSAVVAVVHASRVQKIRVRTSVSGNVPRQKFLDLAAPRFRYRARATNESNRPCPAVRSPILLSAKRTFTGRIGARAGVARSQGRPSHPRLARFGFGTATFALVMSLH